MTLLLSINVQPAEENGNIKLLTDDKGNLYSIPNFCIAEPLYRKEFNKDLSDDKTIEITLIDVFKPKHNKLNFCKSNKITGIELKKLFAEKEGKDLNKFRIRLLLNGQEIKDDHCVLMHSKEPQVKIQVCINEIPKDEIDKEKKKNELTGDNENNLENINNFNNTFNPNNIEEIN